MRSSSPVEQARSTAPWAHEVFGAATPMMARGASAGRATVRVLCAFRARAEQACQKRIAELAATVRARWLAAAEHVAPVGAESRALTIWPN